MKILHIVESLTVGGGMRVIENLALLGTQHGVPTMVIGFKGSADYVGYLRERGIECRPIESYNDRLTYLRDLDPEQTGIVIHRGGGQSQVWDNLIDALARAGHRRLIERNIFGYADTGVASRHIRKVCFNSMHSLWRAWHALGAPPIGEFLDRHRVLYNPVMLDPSPDDVLSRRRAARRAYGVPEDAFVIGDVCRPAPEKLDAMLLGVSRTLLRRIPNLRLLTRSYPQAMASALSRRLGDRYVNLPVTNEPGDAFDTVCAMDAFVHMSTMGESFGMANAEAMRCGIPVICNETPGPKCNNAQRELIRNGVTGFFANDPHRLIESICALAASPDVTRQMGEAARQQFRTGALAPDHIISDLLRELFDGAVGEQAAQAPDKQELADYLGGYDDGLVVPARTGNLLSPLSLSVTFRRAYWRVQRKRIGR